MILNTLKKLTLLLLTVSIGGLQLLNAQDIDSLFNRNERPKVLIIVDSSIGYQAQQRCSQIDQVNCPNVLLDEIKHALMETFEANSNRDYALMSFNQSEGGFILAGFGSSPQKLLDATQYLTSQLPAPISETLFEAYLYLSGQQRIYSMPQHLISKKDRTIEYGNRYVSPFSLPDNQCCSNINIKLITAASPSFDSEQDPQIKTLSSLTTEPINNSYLHLLANYLHQQDLWPTNPQLKNSATISTISFKQNLSNEQTLLLQRTASLGGGDYDHIDSSPALISAINRIDRVAKISNVRFTAPVIDQRHNTIYYGMFEPQPRARWRGNLKKLALKNHQIVDSNNNLAIDPLTGLIANDARTFWLPSTHQPDGNDVTKGGVNQQLSSSDSRQIFTDVGTGLFNISNGISAAGSHQMLAKYMATDVGKLTDLFRWASGIDIDDQNNDGSQVDYRHDIMADPLHSQPVLIHYSPNNTGILVTTNGGFIHLFSDSGNKITENWAFIPYQLYPYLQALKDNVRATKIYGMDLTPTLHIVDKNNDGYINDDDKVWAFFGMRRGGSSYYALDITNPQYPRLMWTINNTGLFSELGQSWSKPTVIFVNIKGYRSKPLLVFGAGYDSHHDQQPLINSTNGRGLYIVDAQTGKLVWSLTPTGMTHFPGQHSITSEIATLDSDNDGFVDRLYASDLGGNIWRIDLPGQYPLDYKTPWSVFKLASLASSSTRQQRQFFYQPTIAQTLFSHVTTNSRINTQFTAIAIGSGNRTRPKHQDINNYFYMLRDKQTVTKSYYKLKKPTVITSEQLVTMNQDYFAQAATNLKLFNQVEQKLSRAHGWKYRLKSGEKVLSKARINSGVIYFSGYQVASSPSNQCLVSDWAASLYAFHLHYATQIYDKLSWRIGRSISSLPPQYLAYSDNQNAQWLTLHGGTNGATLRNLMIMESLVPLDINGNHRIDFVSSKAPGLRLYRSYSHLRTGD
ncbi:MAG: hypothetical protein HRU24_02425 [Gammaproteobacteria bacterium]|nr:hypothetical protein [Gammaproteobacteria bacterium]